MSDPRIRLLQPDPAPHPDARRPLGRMLVEAGHVSATDLLETLGTQKSADVHLGELLIARGLVSEAAVYQTLALQQSAQYVAYDLAPPDLNLQSGVDAVACLALSAVPWTKIGNITCVACAEPARFGDVKRAMPEHLGPLLMVVASRADIERAIRAANDARLADHAEFKMPPQFSCRSVPALLTPLLSLVGVALIAGFLTGWLTLSGLFAAVFLFATSMVFVGMALKTAGALLHIASSTPILARAGAPPRKLPCVSLLVPLHDEAAILPDLVHRLTRLDYPKELLDVLLVVEAEDATTHAHLQEITVPPWMRVITVPPGQITTKPRAMNYALPLCKGSIIGIYDAEDAPHPSQVRDVVAAFANAPEQTACIQAVLDFYNAKSNAMARFFAIEYAAWFRLILPGVARLGFAIPLGGTSVFFKRAALEAAHGWDAHNVTEDADLGIRLARMGFKTQLISSVTLEEANNRVWPWVKQRSRWLKGYLITYLTHMRHPWRLLVELGPWKFIGFQAFFLSAISQYMLAPLIWSSMILYFGAPHFIQNALPPERVSLIVTAFIATWFGSLAIYLVALGRKQHRHLMPWSLGMSLYLALGTLAIYKGAWELIAKPFYWDKTQHGHDAPKGDD